MDSCTITKLRYLSLICKKNLLKVIYTWKSFSSKSNHQSTKTPLKIFKVNKNYIDHSSVKHTKPSPCTPLQLLSQLNVTKNSKSVKSEIQPSLKTLNKTQTLFDELKESLITKVRPRQRINSIDLTFQSIFGQTGLENLKISFTHKRSNTADQDIFDIL